MDDRNDEIFDDLFEPFELDDGPPPPGETPESEETVDETEPQAQLIACPSCGTPNDSHNVHCEACGARVSTSPLPVAPPPPGGSSPGVRALTVLAAVVLLAALAALIINVLDDDESAATATPSSTTLVTSTTVAFEELIPTSVSASSQLNDSFAASNLIDNNTDTEWQDLNQRGNDAELTFTFAQPVRIVSIEVVNLPDDTRFKQNYRIKGYVIEVDDLAIGISGELDDSNDPQRIQVGTVATTTLVLEVRTTYPAQAVGDKPPFTELALADIRFFGSTVSE